MTLPFTAPLLIFAMRLSPLYIHDHSERQQKKKKKDREESLNVILTCQQERERERYKHISKSDIRTFKNAQVTSLLRNVTGKFTRNVSLYKR